MKHYAFPIATALLIAASSVATAQQPATKGSQAATPSQAGTKSGNQAGAQGGSMEAKAMTQAKVTKSLQNAGFTDIRVVDATYLIHAKTSDGNNVVIYIDPPTSMTAASAGSADGSADGAGSSTSTGSSTGSGSGSKSAK